MLHEVFTYEVRYVLKHTKLYVLVYLWLLVAMIV